MTRFKDWAEELVVKRLIQQVKDTPTDRIITPRTQAEISEQPCDSHIVSLPEKYTPIGKHYAEHKISIITPTCDCGKPLLHEDELNIGVCRNCQ